MSERQELVTVVAMFSLLVLLLRSGAFKTTPKLHSPDTDIDPSRHKHDGTQPLTNYDGNKKGQTDEMVREISAMLR